MKAQRPVANYVRFSMQRCRWTAHSYAGREEDAARQCVTTAPYPPTPGSNSTARNRSNRPAVKREAEEDWGK